MNIDEAVELCDWWIPLLFWGGPLALLGYVSTVG